MAKNTKQDGVTITFTPEEVATIMALREGKVSVATPEGNSQQALADAFISAIERTKPPTKKTSANRPRNGPYEPKDGKPKPKLKRAFLHHGVELDPNQLYPREIELLNQIKPGNYSGNVVVIKRRDRSYDIDYPMRTAAQRMNLVSRLKVTSFESLLERLIAEAADPAKYKGPDED